MSVRHWLRLSVAALCVAAAFGQSPVPPVPELAIPFGARTIDGELSDWVDGGVILLAAEAQVASGKEFWSGPEDASGSVRIACDTNHLYVCGVVKDDQIPDDQFLLPVDRADRIELFLGSPAAAEGTALRPAELQFQLMPRNPRRPWAWMEGIKGGLGVRQPGTTLAGVRVATKVLTATSYQFEAAIPFHHLAGLRPGTTSLGFHLVLHDHDDTEGGRGVAMSWNGRDPATGLGVLQLPEPGLLVSSAGSAPLLSTDLFLDLPYLLVPLATVVVLVFLLRGWSHLRTRARWLRPLLLGSGVLLFVMGLWLPSLLTERRATGQREQLDATLATLKTTLGWLESGSLKSYRGPSRDRALMDLLAGRRIVRQRSTSYVSLAELAPDQFGAGVRLFDDLPVRPYWLPLQLDRAESFQFDKPLRGTQLHLVLGRSFVSTFRLPARELETPRLRIEFDFVGGEKRTQILEVDRPFGDASSLGRDYAQVCVVPLSLEHELRTLSVAVLRGVDLRLVGLSLETSNQGQVQPLMLGTPSLGGVLTDLRGAYPQDAGIELAPNAKAKVTIPRTAESPQKLWFFYRASYPGQPTANPGARVAEVVLHFRGGLPPRSIVLEHQVSMFYEMAVHNTRDDPPEGSPATIALSWIDESQEKRVNLVYPVLDLPAGAELDAIEFRNLAEYRLRFRSVVFGNERSAAPQDPPESPLQREGLERWLTEDWLQSRGLRDAADVLIYRGDRLSESTLTAEQQREVLALPRAVSSGGTTTTEVVHPDGRRRVSLFAPLTGDGWDGAVLAVASTDTQWAAASQSNSLLGFLFCLLGTPMLLVLLSELLATATNLRFRLMSVLSIASLAPLGLLSLVLVRVLESGHAADVQAGMRALVNSAVGQLDDQKERVRGSARQWLHDLASLAASKLEKVPEPQFAKATVAIAAELQKLLSGQLPPEWRGGFLRLEWQPVLGATSASPSVLVVGDERMANVETPARLDPGVFLQWGVMMIGVRAEETVRGGTFSLTAGRPLDGNLLSALAPGQSVLLTDARGYPLVASAGKLEAEPLLASAMDPAAMAQRERALGVGIEERQPVVERVGGKGGDIVYGSDLLRDLQDTPRGLLVIAQPDQRATLDLPVGRIPVRAFFLLVAGSLVVLAAFLSFVVSSRISRPIERLEHGALALSRGVLDTRVAIEEGGQIGRLTRTFNQMAADLQGRLQDLQALNRAMRELSLADEPAALDVLRTFCAAHTAADSVRIVLVESDPERLVVHAGAESTAVTTPGAGGLLARIVGPFSIGSQRGALPAPWSSLQPAQRSVVGLPIVFAGRTRGVVLLGFERLEPLAIDLDLMSTVVAQAAIALERTQLHRHAVQDPVTGAYTPEYFRRRTVDEVSLAQQHGRSLAMVAVALGDGDRRPRGLRRFLGILRERLPADSVLCHEGAGRVLAVLPSTRRAEAEQLLEQAFTAWRELIRQLPENAVEEAKPVGVVVQFPDEAPSTELLFDALRERLGAVHTPGASAMESDESLQRAGVTAISPSMREVYTALRRVAPTDLPILLEGETGVGKEVLTNLLHSWSRRAGGPLVKVHCAALSETLLASELFGHEKGAFTGAERRKIGRFEQADGGTLFLDEVGDIPLEVQVKLLRVLQEREVDRVGGTEPVKVDVRVIAATNRDIARMVAEGKFREDLYYRLQGMVVRVPPLRERKQELGELVEHFRREVVEAGQSHAHTLSTDAMDELYRYDWPGNIRELRNTVFRAMVLARGEVVQQREVLAALTSSAPTMALPAAGAAPAPVAPASALGAGVPAEVRAAASAGGSARGRGRGADSAADGARVGSPEAGPDSGSGAGSGAGSGKPVADPDGDDLATTASPGLTAVGDAAPGGAASLAPPVEELSPRLLALYELAVAKGTVKTEDHMAAAGVSHRTGLRDLQYLVKIGLLQRVGSRRGACYRPTRPRDV